MKEVKTYNAKFQLTNNDVWDEKDLKECLEYLKCSMDDFVNTAVKRFISRVIGEKDGERFFAQNLDGTMDLLWVGKVEPFIPEDTTKAFVRRNNKAKKSKARRKGKGKRK